MTQILLRSVFMGVALGLWFWTQSLLGKRSLDVTTIGDKIHDLTQGWNKALHRHPKLADGLLILSSLFIDALGLFVILYSILGPSIRPLIGLLLIFSLRQVCQALTALPPPNGMIWRNPGFPTFLVTYGVSSDLFFSGHTAIVILGTLVAAGIGIPWLTTVAIAIALFEVGVVLVLRAHYTMDVFAGAVVAFWIWGLSSPIALWLDRLLATFTAS